MHIIALVDIAKQFSKAIVPFGVPVISVRELLLLCPLSALGIVSVFSFSHCGGCVVVSHCDFHFPLEMYICPLTVVTISD